MYWIISFGDGFEELIICKTKDREEALRMANITDDKYVSHMLCTSDILCLSNNAQVMIRF